MMQSLFWIFAFLITSAFGGRTPSITWITKEQVVDIGSSIALECSVQYAEDYYVLWVKRGVDGTQNLPISVNTGLIIRDHRYNLKIVSSTYTLEIRDLQEHDGGDYMCQVLVSLTDRISATVHVLVRRPPIISDNSTRSVIIVSEGAMVNLECYAEGVPIPKVSWRREGNATLPTGGSVYTGHLLKIKSMKKEDRGTYTCIAENGVGRGARRNINVEVEFRPVVTITKPVVYQALLFDAILECTVEAYPPAAISWVYERETLVNNRHYAMSQFATADEFTDATLRVKTIEKRQYGNYSCRGDNKLGRSRSQVVLIETDHEVNVTDDHEDVAEDKQDVVEDKQDVVEERQALMNNFVKDFANSSGRGEMEFNVGTILEVLVITVKDLARDNASIYETLSNVTLKMETLERDIEGLRQIALENKKLRRKLETRQRPGRRPLHHTHREWINYRGP